jgi:transcription termination/antitermination protein NusG
MLEQLHPESIDWFAIWTRSRHEKSTEQLLLNKGIETFLPLIERDQQWSDRRKRVSFPLFPGYLFCRVSSYEFSDIRCTKGVAQILGMGNGPVPVPDEEISGINMLVNSNTHVDLYPSLPVGTHVTVTKGPLQGVRGILVKWKDNFHVVVTVEMFQNGAAAIISPDHVQPI